jgi:hypothetical protein
VQILSLPLVYLLFISPAMAPSPPIYGAAAAAAAVLMEDKNPKRVLMAAVVVVELSA